MPKLTSVGVVLVGLALASCGGADGDKISESNTASEESGSTFDGVGYSFSYPVTWVRLADPSLEGTRPEVIFGLDQPAEDILSYNAMSLLVTTARHAVTEEDLALARKEGETLAREAADHFGGRVTSEPTVRRVAGLPGVEMEVSGSEGGHPVRLRMNFAWDGRTQYFFRCTYTQSHVQEMNSGCDQVLDSFQLD